MRLVVLSDNNKQSADYESEHGLSVYLKKDGIRYLFDTGASGLFIRNAERAGVDLSKVDYLFVSHGHNDHLGGLPNFLEVNQRAVIVLSKYALNRKLYSLRETLRPIGTSFDLTSLGDRLLLVGDEPVMDDNFIATHVTTGKYPASKANKTLLKATVNGLEPDDFNHEIVVAVGQSDWFVYTGCAHKGLLNMLATVEYMTSKPIRFVAGGFHLPDSRDENFETSDDLSEIAEILIQNYPEVRFFTGHCTGKIACTLLKERLRLQLEFFLAGYVWKSIT
ncbi:MAG: MBL fold metallo-hydrolase [Paludibacter sp.]|nr:MBL fold metallo-hydrolase [Paludibacter sp.]